MADKELNTTVKVSSDSQKKVNALIGHNGCKVANDVIQWLLKNQK